jgi:hypothetical protein
MSRPFDENSLREALHAALDDVPVRGVSFDAVAASVRRRRLVGAAGGTAAAVLAGVAMAFGLAGPGTGHGNGGRTAAPPGLGSAHVSPAGSWSPPAVVPAGPEPSLSPSPPSPPSAKPRTTPRPSGSVSRPAGHGAADYCPPSDSGKIDWPPVDDPWLNSSTGWAGPGSGPAVPFPANQVIICRYATSGNLAGAGQVTAPATVGELEDAVNSATQTASDNPCQVNGMTYVFFTAGDRAAFFTFDLTDCNAWMMPQSVIVGGTFGDRLRTLSPAATRG